MTYDQKTTRPLVSVIVVNLNGRNILERCLSSIRAQSFKDFEFIVVDNGSKDGSVEFVSKAYPSAILIRNKQNLGFCTANNQGIAASKGKFIVPINNDVVLHKDFLQQLVKTAEANDRIGMVSCKRFFADGKKIDNLGLSISAAFTSLLVKDRSQPIFCPDDGACLWRREMLDEISVLDEWYDNDFFIYHEDFDIGIRARLLGWQCAFADKAVAFHECSATIAGMGSMKSFLEIRNSLLVLLKNAPLKVFLFRLPFITADFFAAFTSSILSGKGLLFLKAKLSALLLLPKMLKKRKAFFKKINSKKKKSIQFSWPSGLFHPYKNPPKEIR